jgi:hypothetical protein
MLLEDDHYLLGVSVLVQVDVGHRNTTSFDIVAVYIALGFANPWVCHGINFEQLTHWMSTETRR